MSLKDFLYQIKWSLHFFLRPRDNVITIILKLARPGIYTTALQNNSLCSFVNLLNRTRVTIKNETLRRNFSHIRKVS